MLKRVVSVMQNIAPLQLSAPWDNTGILLEAPFPRQNANKIFLTIDLTEKVLDEALSDPSVGVIVSYHPPLFKSFKKLCLNDWKQRIALKCAASGVSIYSPHTALDAAVGGINDWIAKGLGNSIIVPITPQINPPENQEYSGEGRLLTLDTPIALDDLISRVKSHMKLKYVRVARAKDTVQTIAICAGSGISVVGGTRSDVWLTGEMSHHELLDAVANGTSNSERGYLENCLKPKLEEQVYYEVVVSKQDHDPLMLA
ncbi:hypothetical protein HDV01_005457 [Terramyces sp. JEL0728]|nr:hypothetical protein HDV01_005457 [Terramyces sp. JEL0728]